MQRHIAIESPAALSSRVIAILVGVTLFATAARAQPIDGATLISDRVGETIDSLEQEYFGLFRDVKSFTGATLKRNQGGEDVDIPMFDSINVPFKLAYTVNRSSKDSAFHTNNGELYHRIKVSIDFVDG